MAKYNAYTVKEAIQEASTVNDDGCAQYSFFNAGNVNVTIDSVIVLLPRQSFEGPNVHPDVSYHDSHTISFDEANAPTVKTPVGGVMPDSTTVAPGTTPDKDRRVIFIKSFIK